MPQNVAYMNTLKTKKTEIYIFNDYIDCLHTVQSKYTFNNNY